MKNVFCVSKKILMVSLAILSLLIMMIVVFRPLNLKSRASVPAMSSYLCDLTDSFVPSIYWEERCCNFDANNSNLNKCIKTMRSTGDKSINPAYYQFNCNTKKITRCLGGCESLYCKNIPTPHPTHIVMPTMLDGRIYQRSIIEDVSQITQIDKTNGSAGNDLTLKIDYINGLTKYYYLDTATGSEITDCNENLSGTDFELSIRNEFAVSVVFGKNGASVSVPVSEGYEPRLDNIPMKLDEDTLRLTIDKIEDFGHRNVMQRFHSYCMSLE